MKKKKGEEKKKVERMAELGIIPSQWPLQATDISRTDRREPLQPSRSIYRGNRSTAEPTILESGKKLAIL